MFILELELAPFRPKITVNTSVNVSICMTFLTAVIVNASLMVKL